MNEKHNDATHNRPEGDRDLDASLIRIDILSYMHQIKEEDAWRTSDRNAITIYKTDGMRMVLMALHEGAELKPHTANGVLNLQILEGSIRFNTEEKSVDVKKGQIVALHKGILHSVYAIEETTCLLTISNEK